MTKIKILSWNIQASKGVDGHIDVTRIANDIVALGSADIICLQEVVRHVPHLTNGVSMDQVALFSRIFSDYTAIFRPSIDMSLPELKQRSEFGCLILTRFKVLETRNHLLPFLRKNAHERSMQRQLLELVLIIGNDYLRVSTTHLEFRVKSLRTAQIKRIKQIQFDNIIDPFIPSIICGDFNFLPNSDEYQQITDGNRNDFGKLYDLWKVLNPIENHDATCGIADHLQWPEGKHCRDYFFATNKISNNLVHIGVEQSTQSSDHQPIFIEFNLQ